MLKRSLWIPIVFVLLICSSVRAEEKVAKDIEICSLMKVFHDSTARTQLSTITERKNNEPEHRTSSPDVQRSGCCSWHGGVCGCRMGRALCCDGTLSPSCGCD